MSACSLIFSESLDASHRGGASAEWRHEMREVRDELRLGASPDLIARAACVCSGVVSVPPD